MFYKEKNIEFMRSLAFRKCLNDFVIERRLTKLEIDYDGIIKDYTSAREQLVSNIYDKLKKGCETYADLHIKILQLKKICTFRHSCGDNCEELFRKLEEMANNEERSLLISK